MIENKYDPNRPDKFWENIPGGENNPSVLNDKLISLSNNTNELQFQLPQTDLKASLVIRDVNGDSFSAHQEVDEAFSAIPNWRSELREVLTYQFENKKLVKDLIKIVEKHSGKRIRIFIIPSSLGKFEGAARLTDKQGEFHGVFVHQPETIEDIIGVLHELGHVIAQTKALQTYQSEYSSPEVFGEYRKAADRFNKVIEEIDIEEELDFRKQVRWDAAQSILEESVGTQRVRDLEMIMEMDAWSAALELASELNLKPLLNNKETVDHILFAIKTRLPGRGI